MTTVTIIQGIIAKIINIQREDVAKDHENPFRIFNNAWPDIILANKRIAKLKTLAKKDITSILTTPGAIISGTPFGKNKRPIFHLFL